MTSEEVFRLNYRNVPAGTYHVEIGLFEGTKPIKLGIKQERLLADGYYRLSEIQVAPL